jgi:tetratricopeptide (TPR) repeat protein
MNLSDCYRLLELSSQASLAEVKASYRKLARRYHPDVNPGDRRAQDKFIQLTAAYKVLVETLPPESSLARPVPVKPAPPVKVTVNSTPAATKTEVSPPVSTPSAPPLSSLDENLKKISYQQLQELLKYKRFPRAIALVEGLAQRLPEDIEVRQWQAIAYQCWGRYLIQERQLDKARIYLKKALHTDPHNRSLWAEVERDFRKLERVF